MKVHQNANGRLCWCTWCAPRLTTFRIGLADMSADQDARDYELMLSAGLIRQSGLWRGTMQVHTCGAGYVTAGGEHLYRGPSP